MKQTSLHLLDANLQDIRELLEIPKLKKVGSRKWGQTFKFQLTIISKWIEYGYGEAIEGGI